MGVVVAGPRPQRGRHPRRALPRPHARHQGTRRAARALAPELIEKVHRDYLEAGADLIITATFNGSAISLADYGLEQVAPELNLEAARLARRVADEWSARTPREAALRGRRPRAAAQDALALAGRERSRVPRRDLRPGARRYATQVRGLLEGGVDALIIETIFDTLNAKAAIVAIEEVFAARGARVPVHGVGHVRRQERPQPLGPDGRRVLELDPPREADQCRRELRARRDASRARISKSSRASRTPTSRVTRTRACPTRSAATTRRRRRWRRSCASSRSRAS